MPFSFLDRFKSDAKRKQDAEDVKAWDYAYAIIGQAQAGLGIMRVHTYEPDLNLAVAVRALQWSEAMYGT